MHVSFTFKYKVHVFTTVLYKKVIGLNILFQLLLSKYTPKLCIKICWCHNKCVTVKEVQQKLKYVIVWKINALCTLTCRWAWFSYRLSSSWVNPPSVYPIHYPTLSPGLCTLLLCNYLVTYKHDPVYQVTYKNDLVC